MRRTDIINSLIKKNAYATYLEIGVRNPADNFNRIDIKNKDGVDPAGRCNHIMTSDDFFKSISEDRMYDIIFIDGLHLEEQVDKDIMNSLNHLNVGGIIVMHDCNPPSIKHQSEHYDGKSAWNGTVWRSYAKLRINNPNLHMQVVDTDWGVGLIKRGTQELYKLDEPLTYNLLENNRTALLNLISPSDFITYYL